MRAGSLNRRIELQHRTTARSAYGEQTESYSTYATVWANKADVRAREFIAAQQEIAENTAKFTLRYRSDVLNSDRIVCASVTYSIRQVAEIGRRQGLEVLATAVVP